MGKECYQCENVANVDDLCFECATWAYLESWTNGNLSDVAERITNAGSPALAAALAVAIAAQMTPTDLSRLGALLEERSEARQL